MRTQLVNGLLADLLQVVRFVRVYNVYLYIFTQGGGSRFTQRNAHQVPHVVILAGPNNVGIHAICAARHLANHKVCVNMVFICLDVIYFK